MIGTALNILIVIIAFIFAVTTGNTISKEAKTIGTLRASGYTRWELIRHYMAMPMIVTLISAAVGNLLGYSALKQFVVSMYYNSYSLPTYETIWNSDAFVKTTIIPLILMFAVNLVMIAYKLRHTPLEFLRGDLKKDRRKRAIRLPDWKFFRRFRLRILFQNIPNYLILFFGVFFVSNLLAMAVGLPETLDYYKENAGSMMLAKYQYILNSHKDENGSLIQTGVREAEPFCVKSLQRKGDSIDEEISVYGVMPESRYAQIEHFQSLENGEVYLSTSFRDKYHVSAGDVITLDEKYEKKQYVFTVAGFYDKVVSLSVYMPLEQFRSMFDLQTDEFSGYLSDTEITDIKEDRIATVITKRDITKMTDQLDHSMGAYMNYLKVLCILLSAVLIYLLTKIIIEKNENAISMTKILGYKNQEIASLYMSTTTVILLASDALGIALGSVVMSTVWEKMMSRFSGWYTFRIGSAGYAKMFLFILVGYLIVMCFDFIRIKRIPMDEALKNVE